MFLSFEILLESENRNDVLVLVGVILEKTRVCIDGFELETCDSKWVIFRKHHHPKISLGNFII